jgi:hypothetical protein
MRDTANTTWRRLSDQAQKNVDSRSPRGGQPPPVQVKEAQPRWRLGRMKADSPLSGSRQ